MKGLKIYNFAKVTFCKVCPNVNKDDFYSNFANHVKDQNVTLKITRS